MNTGDLIMVYISTVSVDDTGFSYIGAINVGPELQATDLVLSPRTVVNIAITPEAGAATNVDFITPSSYGVKETLQLFP